MDGITLSDGEDQGERACWRLMENPRRRCGLVVVFGSGGLALLPPARLVTVWLTNGVPALPGSRRGAANVMDMPGDVELEIVDPHRPGRSPVILTRAAGASAGCCKPDPPAHPGTALAARCAPDSNTRTAPACGGTGPASEASSIMSTGLARSTRSSSP